MRVLVPILILVPLLMMMLAMVLVMVSWRLIDIKMSG
jgi:hypothetical protein